MIRLKIWNQREKAMNRVDVDFLTRPGPRLTFSTGSIVDFLTGASYGKTDSAVAIAACQNVGIEYNIAFFRFWLFGLLCYFYFYLFFSARKSRQIDYFEIEIFSPADPVGPTAQPSKTFDNFTLPPTLCQRFHFTSHLSPLFTLPPTCSCRFWHDHTVQPIPLPYLSLFLLVVMK